MEYSHARRRAENRQVLYLDPCFVFTLSLEIASLEILFIGPSPLVQCSLAVRLALLFCQRAPPCSTVLVPALCVVGLPAVLRSYLSGWVYHFRCRLPGIPSIHSTTQSAASVLVLSWRWLSHAHPPWAITSAQVLWFICCADDVMWRENTSRASLSTKAKSAHKPSKLTRIHSRTHPLASKMLTLQY